MKKLIPTLTLLLFTSMAFSQGSDIQSKNPDRLKVSPIRFASSYFEMSYELMLRGNKSLSISPMVMLQKNNSEEFRGIQLEMQYRIYLKQLSRNTSPTWIFSNIGLYTGLYANGLIYTEEAFRSGYDPDRNQSIEGFFTKDVNAAETGVFVGLQFIFSEKIVLDFTVGGGVRYSDVTDEFEDNYPDAYSMFYEVFDIEYYGVKPKLNLQLGITL